MGGAWVNQRMNEWWNKRGMNEWMNEWTKWMGE